MNPSDNEKLKFNSEWQSIIKGCAVAVTIRNSNNKNVVLAAVKLDPSVFKYVSEEFKKDPDIILAAIELENPSFMGKAHDEIFLSNSLESISRHLHIVYSDDLNFLNTCKTNSRYWVKEINSMRWYRRNFSKEVKQLKMLQGLYREKIRILMKKIREDDKYQQEQREIELRKRKGEEEFQKYSDWRKKIKQMPIYERWKQDVIQKCGNKCQLDKSHADRYAEVHHIVSLYKIYKQINSTSTEEAIKFKLLWNVDNGIVLCKECHDTMESSQNRQIMMSKK
ncbi:MAG: DUF4116 domain-containing protein [Candidatus Nomurabacteria bacterium]|nr:DUF4116 domain-containing protein [Candidatus Nomurabacteria bacterium]